RQGEDPGRGPDPRPLRRHRRRHQGAGPGIHLRAHGHAHRAPGRAHRRGPRGPAGSLRAALVRPASVDYTAALSHVHPARPAMSDRNPSAVSSPTEEPGLKKVLGPGLLLLFIVGDILGTGVYALTGQVAGQVGGAGWAPLLLAFGMAMLTALSYLELVTKYPRAAGA